jgi:translocation and assembly module TamB
LEAGENSRAYYRGNAFEISKGEVQFKDPKSVDIFVDLNAQTQVREFLITLKTFGRAAAPRVLLTSEPPLSEADILTLLTLGVTSRDTAITDRALSGISLAAEALLSASGLSQRVQKFLPKNNFLKDLQMYMATTYNSATRQVEPAWMMESKLLIEELKLSVVQPVSGFRGNRVQAEYRINEQLSLRAQWDNENQGYSFGNPGLDLKMRFEWE